MSFKKQILEELSKLRDSLLRGKLTEEQMTSEVISLKSQIDASNAKMTIGQGDNLQSINIIDNLDSNYTIVQKNAIPNGYGWIYWRYIMDIGMIWLNRYSKFECPNNLDYEEIINAIFICILYGVGAYDKETNTAYFPSFSNNKLVGYEVGDCYQYDFYNKNDKGWVVNKKYKYKNLNKDNVVIFQWQMGKIGIFVWYLQELMNYLLMKDILLLNTNALGASLVMEVKDLQNFKQEYRYLTNARAMIKPVLTNSDGFVNKLINVSPEIAPHIESILTALRYQKEEMFNMWGISITSAKQQSLSADANLSASISETRAYEHDRRIEKSLKELGIKLEINKPEVIKPYNENADKQGMGETNTEEYFTERKSE